MLEGQEQSKRYEVIIADTASNNALFLCHRLVPRGASLEITSKGYNEYIYANFPQGPTHMPAYLKSMRKIAPLSISNTLGDRLLSVEKLSGRPSYVGGYLLDAFGKKAFTEAELSGVVNALEALQLAAFMHDEPFLKMTDERKREVFEEMLKWYERFQTIMKDLGLVVDPQKVTAMFDVPESLRPLLQYLTLRFDQGTPGLLDMRQLSFENLADTYFIWQEQQIVRASLDMIMPPHVELEELSPDEVLQHGPLIEVIRRKTSRLAAEALMAVTVVPQTDAATAMEQYNLYANRFGATENQAGIEK